MDADLSDEQRGELASAIVQRRRDMFETRKAAYIAAEVNPATWSRAEEGLPVRPDRLRRILITLWPQSNGDWTALINLVGADPDAGGYVSAPGHRIDMHDADDQVLDEIRQMRDELVRMQQRLDRLEGS